MSQPRELDLLDALAGLVALGAIAGCLGFPWTVAPRFAGLFRDFGPELPLSTRLALSGWFPPLVSLPAAAFLAVGLATRRSLWLMASVLCGLLAGGGCLLAMYLPIFAVAGAVQP